MQLALRSSLYLVAPSSTESSSFFAAGHCPLSRKDTARSRSTTYLSCPSCRLPVLEISQVPWAAIKVCRCGGQRVAGVPGPSGFGCGQPDLRGGRRSVRCCQALVSQHARKNA